MKKELVSILSDLIALPSPYPPGTSVEICAYAAKRLKAAGYKVEIATKAKGVDNVVARRKGKAKGPTIAFNAHVDTVGVGERANWKSDPYKALVKGGLVYGLGAGNCKGSMAVQLWLAEEIARRGGPAKGELIFTFVADEENLGPNGMEFLRKSGKVRPDALILGAQTENNLIVAERGVLWAQDHDQGQGRPRRQPVGRRQRHPAHDAAGGRAAVLLRQGARQARLRRDEVDGQHRHVPWRPQHQRRALGLHRRDRPPPAARREGEGRLRRAEEGDRRRRASRRASTRSSS